jgi:hypothetical protein
MIRFLLLFLLAGLLAPGAGATQFSSEGYGWWWDETDPAALGRGGTSIAVTEFGSLGATNPSVAAMADLSYGQISYGGELWDVKSAEGTFKQRADLLPQFGGLIALPRGIRVGGLMRVQTDAAYERERVVGDVDPYTVRTTGNGGLNRLQLLVAGSLFGRRLGWGAGLARVQGSVREEWRYEFEGSGTRDIRQVIEGRLKGGWVHSAGLLLRPVDKLWVGLAAGFGGSSRLIQDTEVLQGSSFDSTLSGRQELPAQRGFGLRVGPIRHLYLSFDMVQTLWKDAALEVRSGGPKIYPYEDASRWGVGLEHSKRNDNTPARAYRIGYQKVASYLRDAGGVEIGEWAFTVGLREPIGKRRAAFDLALEYGKRGNQAELGIEETFIRILAGITFASVVREY